MVRLFSWLLRLLLFWLKRSPAPQPTPPATEPVPDSGTSAPPGPLPTAQPAARPEPLIPQAKRVVTLLIYPTVTDGDTLNQSIQVGNDTYYTSSPWEVNSLKVNEAIRSGEDWLATILGTRIHIEPVRLINSQLTLNEWRSRSIGILREEVAALGLPWTGDYIYLAFVRGMGGYAGGIAYQNSNPGYAMVGDICLEAICEYGQPTSGSVLLGQTFPPNAYSKTGQTAAFVHEALHGLDLPHPDGWPESDQPGWDETIMGHWWNMPNFNGTDGLTQREIDKVLRWTAGQE